MTNLTFIVLNYHRFTTEEDEYIFSRTYKQFNNDLASKDFDLITVDDGHRSVLKAAKMMELSNVRAKLFINPGTIDTPGHCSWSEIKELARYHDIENHSLDHLRLVTMDDKEIFSQIWEAQEIIAAKVGRRPRFFVPPWNHYDNRVEGICEELGLQILRKRFTIKNITP